MLERDGFRVISSVAASEDLTRAASVMQPDAVVLGEELLDVRGAEAARLVRHACPEAKIVVFSALPAAAAVGPGEPDAVLERGIGLKDLTPALNDLFEPAASGVVATLPVAKATAPPTARPAPARPTTRPAVARGGDSRRRSVVVLTAAAAAMLLLVFAVARTFPGNDGSTRADASPSSSLGLGAAVPSGPSAGSAGVGAAQAPNVAANTHVDAVRQTLEALTQAARGGSLPDVLRLTRELLSERGAAQAAGADVGQLNDMIASTLQPLSASQYGSALRMILGPTLVPPAESSTPDAPATDKPGDGGTDANGGDGGTAPEPPPPTESGGTDGGPTPPPEPEPSETPSPVDSGSEADDGDDNPPGNPSSDSGDSGDDGGAPASRAAGGGGCQPGGENDLDLCKGDAADRNAGATGGDATPTTPPNAEATPADGRQHPDVTEDGDASAPEPGDDGASAGDVD